jgi:site-specific DNA-methyltransferase (adenine-specific)
MNCENKVILGDSLEYIKQISDNSIDLIYTDPPYYITEKISVIKRGNTLKYKGNDLTLKNIQDWDVNQWKNEEEYNQWMYEYIKEFKRILKPDRHVIIWVDKKKFSKFGEFAESLGFKFRTPLFWRKTNPVPQARGVSPTKSIEMVLWLTNGKSKQEFFNYQLGTINDVLDAAIPNVQGGKLRHPTQKPLFVVLFHILYLSKPNDLVLDPFAGSGTTGIACKLTNRNYCLIEQNKEFYENILYRLDNIQDKLIQKEFEKVKKIIYKNYVKKFSLKEIKELIGEKEQKSNILRIVGE